MKISDRKRQILYYFGSVQAEGTPPSVREIVDAVGLSSAGSLHKHLEALEADGYLERAPGKKRNWKLSDKAWGLIGRPSSPSIPLMGRIAAGTPILAEENREYDLPVDPRMFGSPDAFALQVRGDSMIDAHIQDGDLAIIRPQGEPEDGSIMAVQVEDLEPEATLKIVRRRNGTLELHPANAAYNPLTFKNEEQAGVKILGKLIGIIRSRP